MNDKQDNAPIMISKGRFAVGVTVFVVGQATTLLIPFVAASDLATAWKTTISSLLFFITPQIGIVLAVAILGKAGWDYLMKLLFGWLKRYAPPEAVSPVRYRIGLIMFGLPLLFAWFEPYGGHLIPGYGTNRILFCAVGDVMFIASFFVLGGEFWDKIRSLFIHRAKAQFPEDKR